MPVENQHQSDQSESGGYIRIMGICKSLALECEVDGGDITTMVVESLESLLAKVKMMKMKEFVGEASELRNPLKRKRKGRLCTTGGEENQISN